MKIAIIGGGYTGLTAAFELQKSGNEVVIIEKNNELGGLASGFVLHGTNIEKTYHHIFRSDKDLINILPELGIENKLEWHASSVGLFYEGKIYRFGTPVSLIKFPPLSLINRFRVGFVMLYLKKTFNWQKFKYVSAHSWLKKWTGDQAMKVIWEPLLKGKFDKYYDKVSMAWMWARLNIRANSQERGGEKLGYFKGGFDVITRAFEEKIKKNGGKIFTGINLDKIKTKANGKLSININSKAYEFDKVIATVPSHVLPNLLDTSKIDHKLWEDYEQKLNSIEYLGAVVAVFSSTQDLGQYYWNNINDLEFPFLAFINHTKLIDKANYEGKNVYYIGTYIPHDHKYFQISDEEVYNLWFEYLQKLFPEFSTKEVIEKHMFKFKNAQHIVDLDYESKIPPYKTPIDGVYLANFSQIFPEDRGTNYAVREGKKIAEIVMNS